MLATISFKNLHKKKIVRSIDIIPVAMVNIQGLTSGAIIPSKKKKSLGKELLLQNIIIFVFIYPMINVKQ